MLRSLERSLRRKVMALVVATTVSALLLSALGLVIYDLQAYERQASADLASQAEVLARAAAPALSFNDQRTAEEDLSVMQVRPHVLAAALYTRDNQLFAGYVKRGAVVPPFPPRPGADGYAIEAGNLVLFRRVVENNDFIGTVYIRGQYKPWDRLRDYLTILFVVMIASLALALVLSGWLQSAVTTPILEIARISREVMERRDYSLRVAKTTEDEIGQLVDAFNAMLAEVGRRSEALREADKRKDEFLATLAHELRNPLAPIRNALEILRIAGNDPQKSLKAREMMERQLNQMVRLVDDLLDVSRITTGKLTVRRSVMDLHGAIRDAIETARPFVEARKHQLDVVFDPEPLPVNGDRTRLGQVFANLVNNAAKYTEPGGRIVVTVRREARHAVVSVKDTGIGLTRESIAAIFDMFVQVDRTLERSQAGLGVGLTLARRLVELHEGQIEVVSAGPGQGSEFVVRLPLASGVQGTVLRDDSSGPRRRRVLLADDNIDFANSLAALLTERGHEVRVAHDGAAALVAAEEFSPDVAFVDLGMPKVQGYEVARRLRALPRTASCVLVAVTAWGKDNDRRRAHEAGFDRHLVKPVDPHDIEEILEGV